MSETASFKSNAQNSKTIRYVVIFCILLIVIILIACMLRAIKIITQSSFDPNRHFTLALIKQPNTFEILSVSPETQTASLLKINGNIAPKNLESATNIYIDASANFDYSPNASTSDQLSDLLFHFNSSKSQNLTIFDAMRLFLFVHSLKPDALTQQALTLPQNATSDNKSLPAAFTDHTLYLENITISIINASNTSGIGSRLATILTNLGANVISVTTAPASQSNTILEYHTRSYTLKQVGKILHVPGQKMQKQSLSDIIITIGTRSLDNPIFY